MSSNEKNLGAVLLVDDDADARVMLSMLLSGYNMTVLEAGSGEEALEILGSASPNLVLLDFDMPGIDGVTTLSKIRERHPLESLPVVMVSNRQDSDVIVRALDSGANDYIHKMTDPTVMLARIRRHLICPRLARKEDRPFGGKLGHYSLGDKMGEGPVADLYRASHIESGERVAVKVLRPGFKADFQTFQAWEPFCNDLLADLQDVQAEPVDYLVYQWVEGASLDEYVEAQKLPRSDVLKFAHSIVQAVNAVHQLGRLHSELRPSNVKILPTGETRILDFGFSELLIKENALKRSDEIHGHPSYLAPEVYRDGGELSRASDLYAIGALIFTLATSTMPFDGSMAEVVQQVLHDKPPRVSDLRPDGDRALDFLCSKLMDKDPRKRYLSCADVLQKIVELREEG